jgi:hypothetical protein
MKAKEILLVLVGAFVLFIAQRAFFPTATRYDIALSGTPGARISGTYECDGTVTPFAAILPTTIRCDAKRDFTFRATKDDLIDTLRASVTSDTIRGECEARLGSSGVEVRYHGMVKGFSSRGSFRSFK